jgi:hypothetical protein
VALALDFSYLIYYFMGDKQKRAVPPIPAGFVALHESKGLAKEGAAYVE